MSRATPKGRILLAEGLSAGDESFLPALERAGLQVEVAPGSLAALELARASRPDAIVAEARDPELVGFELARRVRADPRTWEVAVVLIDVAPDSEAVIQGFDSGADLYLARPFEPSLLVERLQRLFELRATRARRKLEGPRGVTDVCFQGRFYSLLSSHGQSLDYLLCCLEECLRHKGLEGPPRASDPVDPPANGGVCSNAPLAR